MIDEKPLILFKLFVCVIYLQMWAQKPGCVREKVANDSVSAICCDQKNDLAWVASRDGSLQIWHFDSADSITPPLLSKWSSYVQIFRYFFAWFYNIEHCSVLSSKAETDVIANNKCSKKQGFIESKNTIAGRQHAQGIITAVYESFAPGTSASEFFFCCSLNFRSSFFLLLLEWHWKSNTDTTNTPMHAHTSKQVIQM